MTVLGMANEVDGHVFDDGDVLRAASGSEACRVVVEDDIEYPVQPILDAPVTYGSTRRWRLAQLASSGADPQGWKNARKRSWKPLLVTWAASLFNEAS